MPIFCLWNPQWCDASLTLFIPRVSGHVRVARCARAHTRALVDLYFRLFILYFLFCFISSLSITNSGIWRVHFELCGLSIQSRVSFSTPDAVLLLLGRNILVFFSFFCFFLDALSHYTSGFALRARAFVAALEKKRSRRWPERARALKTHSFAFFTHRHGRIFSPVTELLSWKGTLK